MTTHRAFSAAIYGRLSLESEESVSQARQLRECREYAERHGYTVVLEAFDPGVRATKVAPKDRAGWRKITDRADHLDLVIVWALDRLVRSSRDWAAVQEWAEQNKIKIATTHGELDLDDPMGEFQASLMASLGRLEARQIGARAASARKQLVQVEGRRAGGVRPWPFMIADRTDDNGNPLPGKVLRPIPERADAVRWAAQQIIQHNASLHGICREWDRRGLTPNARKGRTDDRWYVSPLKRLLLNPTLIGASIYKGAPVRNADGTIRIDQEQQILDPVTFAEVGKRLSGRVRGTRPPVERLLTGGLLRCATCHGPLTVHASRASYTCARQHCERPVGISIAHADRIYVQEWLEVNSDRRITAPPSAGPDPAEVEQVREALEAIRTELASFPEPDRYAELRESAQQLQARQDELHAPRQRQPVPLRFSDETYGDRYRAARTEAERRAVLMLTPNSAARVLPGVRGGRQSIADRLDFSGWFDPIEADAAADTDTE